MLTVLFRWGDGAGVYYYPAVITELLGAEEVKVWRFLFYRQTDRHLIMITIT